MRRFRAFKLHFFDGAWMAVLGLTAFAPAGDAVAQRRLARGTLEVHVRTGACGTCAMPPGPARPAPGVALRVFREGRRGARTQVSAGRTDAEGVAHFSLRPGRYCVEADSSQPLSDAPSPPETDSAGCENVIAGRIAVVMFDVRACPEHHCTGMER